MAQRTGDLGLLRQKATVASARVILALAAVAALCLAGCGGDSDSESTSAQTQATSAAAAEEAPSSAGNDQKEKQGPKVTLPEGKPEPKASQKQRQETTVANIFMQSPSLKPGPDGAITLPAAYTCDGENKWPALAWKGVPPDTEELFLLALNLVGVEGKLFAYWAVAGLDPKLEGIEEDELPPGAILGRNGFGKADYNICPATEGKESFLFTLYALPKALSPKQGFDPLALRETALEESGNAGLWAASYERGG